MRTLSIDNRLAHAHEFLLPHSHAVKPADAAVYALGPYLLVGGTLEVEERLLALDGEQVVCGFVQQRQVVLVGMARRVVVSVHGAALDVNLDGGPFAQFLGLVFCVGGVKDIVEGILCSVYDIQTLGKFLSSFGIADKVVIHTSSHVERSFLGHISVHKDIEGIQILTVDTGGITHVRASAASHLVIPIVGIAVGCVVVDTEILLVCRPIVVLHLDGNLNHERRHFALAHGLGEFLIAHGLVFGFQLGAGCIFEVGA